jgi:hypothetical protein
VPSRAISPVIDRAYLSQLRVASFSGLAKNKKMLGSLSPFMRDKKLYETEN